MTENNKESWYHCGHCGALFASTFGADETRVCSNCGLIPSTGLEAAEEDMEVKTQQQIPVPTSLKPKVVKRRKKARQFGFVALAAALIFAWFVVHHYIDKSVAVAEERAEKDATRLAAEEAERDAAIKKAVLPLCEQTFTNFLNAEGSEWKSYIWNADESAKVLETAFATFSADLSGTAELTNVDSRMFEVEGEQMIECLWQSEAGESYDTIFRHNGDGLWFLDAKHFFRYSPAKWDDFIAGEGTESHAFRLIVRLAPPDKYEEIDPTRLKVQIAPPPSELFADFPENYINLRLDRRSDEGLILEAMLEDSSTAGPAFGLGQLGDSDPGILRIRASIGRTGIKGFTKFRIEEIYAAHWVDTDVLGLDLEALQDDLFKGGP